MKEMTIELTEGEVTCLLFWFVAFRGEVNATDEDVNLFERLFSLRDGLRPDNHPYVHFTALPPYQPGEGPQDGSGNCAPVVFLGE